jgi:hypothetical protein
MHSHQPRPARSAAAPGNPGIVSVSARKLLLFYFFCFNKIFVLTPSAQPMRPLLLALLQVTSMPLPSPPPPPHTAPDSIAPIDVAETSTPTAALPPPPPSSWGSTDLPLYTQVSPTISLSFPFTHQTSSPPHPLPPSPTFSSASYRLRPKLLSSPAFYCLLLLWSSATYRRFPTYLLLLV